MKKNRMRNKTTWTKSAIAMILAVVLCFMSVCPAMGAEADSETAVQENDIVSTDPGDGNSAAETADEAEAGGNASEPGYGAEAGDTVEPVESVHSKGAAYATQGTDEEKDKWVSFKAVNDGHTLSSKFYYDDSMMLTDANVLSPNLAKVAVGLASAAYIQGDIEQCFGDMEYELLGGQSYNYGKPTTYENNDFVAYSIGHKVIDGHDVYIVAVRGTPKSEEWISNFHLGQSAYHFGFHNAASEIIAKLGEYVSGSDNIFLITGHSRGAAVANIVAGEITSRFSWASAEHVFGYTFACPAVKYVEDASIASNMQNLTNIRNFNAPGDVVKEVPLKDWGYERYGREILLPAEGIVFENFKNRFEKVYGMAFGGKLSTEEFVDSLKTIAATREAFSNISSDNPEEYLDAVEHRMLFDVLGWHLGGMESVTKDAIISYYSIEAGISLGLRIIIKVVANIMNKLLQHNIVIAQAVQNYFNQDEAFYSEINQALDDTIDYTAEQFGRWIKNNGDLVDKIERELGITVEERDDLLEARNKLREDMNHYSTYTGNLVTLVNLFISSGGTFDSFINTIYHSHQQGSYVLWINSMYYGYLGWVNNDSIESVTVPDNTMSIGGYCFSSCDNLKAVSLPDSMTAIGNYAFNGCGALQGIVIPDRVNSIGSAAFHDCTGLASVTLPITAAYDCGTVASGGQVEAQGRGTG